MNNVISYILTIFFSSVLVYLLLLAIILKVSFLKSYLDKTVLSCPVALVISFIFLSEHQQWQIIGHKNRGMRWCCVTEFWRDV